MCFIPELPWLGVLLNANPRTEAKFNERIPNILQKRASKKTNIKTRKQDTKHLYTSKDFKYTG